MPLVVTQGVITDWNKLRALLRTDTENNYNKLMKYMKTQVTIDYETLRLEFHTYTPTTQKTYG